MAEPASRALAPARDQQDASPEQSAAQGAQQRALTAAAHRQTPGPSVRSQLAELPEPWLQRIAQLRAEHRDDEADQELVRFAAKYPELEIPQSARRR